MQISKIGSQDFGMTINKSENSTKAQKRFLKTCLCRAYSLDCSPYGEYERGGRGSVVITEEKNGNTKISLTFFNAWKDEVKKLEEVFELGKENFGTIREQLNEFFNYANFYKNVLSEYSTKSPKKIRELVRIEEDFAQYSNILSQDS